MTPKPGIVCCPHCGSRDGFQTNIVFKAIRVSTWDQSDVDTEDYVVIKETNPICSGCQKSVRAVMQPWR